jgi:hypothetical protein
MWKFVALLFALLAGSGATTADDEDEAPRTTGAGLATSCATTTCSSSSERHSSSRYNGLPRLVSYNSVCRADGMALVTRMLELLL